jgi:acetyltransferase EpsM
MVYLFGASGHGSVILDILKGRGEEIGGFFDDQPRKDIGGYFPEIFPGSFQVDHDQLILSIGDNSIRRMLAQKLEVNFAQAIHSQSILSPSVKIGPGTVVMGGALINAGTIIGSHTIINSMASVDHDCIIGDYVHIAPGCVLCGGVEVGEGTLIGARSVILPNIKIGRNVIIGAGSVVIQHVPDGVTLMGNPAKIKFKVNENRN